LEKSTDSAPLPSGSEPSLPSQVHVLLPFVTIRVASRSLAPVSL
jgi:hypothetical protein